MSIEHHHHHNHRHLHEQLSPGNLQTTSSINSNTSSSSALSTNSSNLSNGNSNHLQIGDSHAPHHHHHHNNHTQPPPSPPLSNLDLEQLPANVRFELDQLELELLEGDITQKGYDKKRAKLLANYLSTIDESVVSSSSSSLKTNGTSEKSVTKIIKENSFHLNCKKFYIMFILRGPLFEIRYRYP
jgi:hypothetical protein